MQEGGLPPSGRVRAVFEEVLAGDDFQYAESAPWTRWLRAFLEFLGDVVSRWWPDLGESDLRLISWVALGILTVTSVLLIHRWAARLERRNRRTARLAEDSTEQLDARSWALRARTAAAAGRYREAATGLYQATILEMDAAGRLRYRDWKTPGDYALEVSGDDAVRAGFIAFLADFLAAAFGPLEPDSSSFAALSMKAEAIGCRA